MSMEGVSIPAEIVGLRLCKIVRNELLLGETIVFTSGNAAVNTTLRRAAISGSVGPVGETGDYWADLIDKNGDWTETVALNRGSWNALKNRWMRCKMESTI